MNLQIISNINYPIGNIINYELQNSSETRIAVAFMKFSGIKKIENSLMQCLQKKSSVEIIVGLDFKTTDPKSMLYLIGLKKDYQNLSFFYLLQIFYFLFHALYCCLITSPYSFTLLLNIASFKCYFI